MSTPLKHNLAHYGMILAFFALPLKGARAADPPKAIQDGRSFLAASYDPELHLLPEYRDAKVYWLFHDNYLAAKVLARSHPALSEQIKAAMDREGISKSGKIEILFGEAKNPLPFRQYALVELRRAGNKIIRTEKVTSKIVADWEKYADLLLLASLAETNNALAHAHWDAAWKMWDGQGFLDAAAKHDKHYATYKLGLALIAARRVSPPVNTPRELLERLMAMQNDAGGWITDYDFAGHRMGQANVETTCFAILGLEAALPDK
ncbi:MAG TPA: hypothetical protein VGE41_00215 [Verrucomicrobiae bacterium]